MNKTFPRWLLPAVPLWLVLTGCQNRDERAYNEVGEMRVFDETPPAVAAAPVHPGAVESVPAPAPMNSKMAGSAPKVSARHSAARTGYRPVMVGELDVND